MDNEKVCRKCNRSRPRTEFQAREKRHARDGLGSYCSMCRGEYLKGWYMKRKSEGRDWYKNNRDRHKDMTLRCHFGIGLEKYNEILESQEGRCAICGKSKDDNKKSLCVDHCHKTGKVRGLLCDHCNKGLGQFMDDPQLLLLAHEYIRRNIVQKINND